MRKSPFPTHSHHFHITPLPSPIDSLSSSHILPSLSEIERRQLRLSQLPLLASCCNGARRDTTFGGTHRGYAGGRTSRRDSEGRWESSSEGTVEEEEGWEREGVKWVARGFGRDTGIFMLRRRPGLPAGLAWAVIAPG
jgi:hypothetical protein